MSEPDKGWQPPPVGTWPSKEALEAADWMLLFFLNATDWVVRLNRTAVANRIEEVAAARVAEATKPTGMDQEMARRIVADHEGPILSVQAAELICEKAIAEARAQERERIASIFDDASKDAAALYILEGFPEDLKEQRAWERIAARIRALAAPQEQT